MKRVWGLLRVLGLAVVLLSSVGVVVAKRAEARMTEVLRGFGEQLVQLHDLSVHSAPRQLFVNGLRLGVVSASTALPVNEALDRFQSLCHGVRDLDVSATLRQKLAAPNLQDETNRAGVIREQTEHEGFVACIDAGERLDGEAWLNRLQVFGRTQDLSALGQMHYALARRHGETTTLVLFWTEGKAKLTELFKQGQDAPGRDLVDVPRPATGKRLLSAFEQGVPYGLAFYRVEDQPLAAVVAAYEANLREGGWRVEGTRKGAVKATKGDRSLLVRVRAGRESQVIVSLLDLG